MDIYNQCNEEVKYSYLGNFFDEILPPKEVYEYIYKHSYLFNRNDGFIIKLSFLDYEMDADVSISKENRTIIYITYREADSIKILEEKNKIFEINSAQSEYSTGDSRTILSLTQSPIVKFQAKTNKEIREIDVDLTNLMLLFDDFDEVEHSATHSKFYQFHCKRFNEVAELIISPTSGKLSLTIKSGNTLLFSLNLDNCDRIVADLDKKKLYFTNGFEELRHISYTACMLDLNDRLYLLVEPNAKPSLRGIG